MSDTNASTVADEPFFQALLTPHRSLGRTGFWVLMSVLLVGWLVSGLVFLRQGAWPVFGFFGLDVLLLYWAFRVSYRSAAAYEEIKVTASALTVRKVDHRGRSKEWLLNPLWVRLDKEATEEFGIARLFLVMRDKQLTVASFLGPEEREGFAKQLSNALNEAKRGPVRTVFS